MRVIMLNPVKLSDQWTAIERGLPADWSEATLRIRPEQQSELGEVARILGSAGAGRVGDELALRVTRAGGPIGPDAARRLFARLDDARLWCQLEQRDVESSVPADSSALAPQTTLVAGWRAALATLPRDWSDLLCELTIESSDFLDRAALHCAPINPTRDGDRSAFTFRCARTAGYGVSPAMAERCFERCDAEDIRGTVTVLRMLSETDNVSTQGTVWLVGRTHR